MSAGARGLAVAERYASALRDYLAGAGEASLEAAYELGRTASAEGLGVLDVARLHSEALGAALQHARTPQEGVRLAERAAAFLAEYLSPFEMTHRGYREAHVRLRELNQRLEQQVVELQQARDAAEAAVRARDEFLSVAAHELKTPVTGLWNYAQLLTRRRQKGASLSSEQLDRALETIDQQSRTLARLVEHLLDGSRLQAGRLALDRESTEVVGLVERVVATARLHTDRHRLVVRTQPPAVQAWVDPLRLQQVITNLVDNALKYSPGGGEVDVAVSTQDGMLQLTVRDYGLGIPPEEQKHVFERFHTAHGAEHRSGLGLGLYITRQIVELHGGQIDVESPPDGGTRFIVTLPRDPNHGALRE